MFKNIKKGKTNIDCFNKGGKYIGFSFNFIYCTYGNNYHTDCKSRNKNYKTSYQFTK